MKKLALILALGTVLMISLVSCAGKAFDDFSASVNAENGFVGCAYNAKN